MSLQPAGASTPTLGTFMMKCVVTHTITYFFVGVAAATLLNYAEAFARPEYACWMRQLGDPMVMLGPLLQPVRGVIFALALFPLREPIFAREHGWLVIWWLLVALGILSTFGPAPGSVEGLIYTVLPVRGQLAGLLEVIPQALLFSVLLFLWIRHPEKRWLGRILWGMFGICMLAVALGVLTQGHR